MTQTCVHHAGRIVSCRAERLPTCCIIMRIGCACSSTTHQQRLVLLIGRPGLEISLEAAEGFRRGDGFAADQVDQVVEGLLLARDPRSSAAGTGQCHHQLGVAACDHRRQARGSTSNAALIAWSVFPQPPSALSSSAVMALAPCVCTAPPWCTHAHRYMPSVRRQHANEQPQRFMLELCCDKGEGAESQCSARQKPAIDSSGRSRLHMRPRLTFSQHPPGSAETFLGHRSVDTTQMHAKRGAKVIVLSTKPCCT